MELVSANTVDAALEKHLPVYEIKDGMINIKVGATEHPMTEEHYISFIILASDNSYMIKKLNANDEPVASFSYKEEYNKIYAYCNLHSLWVTEIK